MEDNGENRSRVHLQVVVRVRPISTTEKEKKHFQCVFPLDKRVSFFPEHFTLKISSVYFWLIQRNMKTTFCDKTDNMNGNLFSMQLLGRTRHRFGYNISDGRIPRKMYIYPLQPLWWTLLCPGTMLQYLPMEPQVSINKTIIVVSYVGSGKTYTMIGTKDRPGVMTLLTRSLYEKIGQGQFDVHLSYLVRVSIGYR